MDSLSHSLALLAPRCEVNLHCRFIPLAGRVPANAQRRGACARGAARRGAAKRRRPDSITCARERSSSRPTVRRIWMQRGAVLPVAHPGLTASVI